MNGRCDFVVLTKVRQRLRGMKSAKIASCGACVVLVPCRDIHTFGMKFPIDVAFVDGGGVVVEAYRRVSRARRLRCPHARMTIERRSCERDWFEPGDCIFAGPPPGRTLRGPSADEGPVHETNPFEGRNA